MSRSASPPGNIGLASSAWAPTANSRTHATRVARQEAGTSTFLLASAPELASGFVGSAEIRWDGNANPGVPLADRAAPLTYPRAPLRAVLPLLEAQRAKPWPGGAGVAVRTGLGLPGRGWPLSRSAAPAA